MSAARIVVLIAVVGYLVVSLLRPEVIRDLKLPQHGLTILPLESTLTPLPNGDYLYRDGDHFRTLRDIARLRRTAFGLSPSAVVSGPNCSCRRQVRQPGLGARR